MKNLISILICLSGSLAYASATQLGLSYPLKKPSQAIQQSIKTAQAYTTLQAQEARLLGANSMPIKELYALLNKAITQTALIQLRAQVLKNLGINATINTPNNIPTQYKVGILSQAFCSNNELKNLLMHIKEKRELIAQNPNLWKVIADIK